MRMMKNLEAFIHFIVECQTPFVSQCISVQQESFNQELHQITCQLRYLIFVAQLVLKVVFLQLCQYPLSSYSTTCQELLFWHNF